MLAAGRFAALLAALGACVLAAAGAPDARGKGATVQLGIEVLEAEGFKRLRGKRVGLITNQTGRTHDGRRTIDVLARAPGVRLVKLFSPEHGLTGQVTDERRIADAVDDRSGLPVFSLYGRTRRPTDEMLNGLDVLVFDIQDAGVRYYTYITTMAYAMEEAAKHEVEFVVLDRPNPLNGVAVNGPMLDADRLSFEGYFPLPLRHGMTVGELARLFNAENSIGARLTVVPMRNWRRRMWFDDTGLEWVDPSPNLQSLTGNTVYPAVELLRAGGVSVGRGTELPFELVGASWIASKPLRLPEEFDVPIGIEHTKLAEYLPTRDVPGVAFALTPPFTPTEDNQAGRVCHGVRIVLKERNELDVGRLGVELLAALWRLYPEDFQLDKTIRLLGSKETLERIRAGDDPKDIVAGWKEGMKRFREMRKRYLLYK
jgi:uncharacterized protein YbbC (DUF1343 family)